MRLYRVCQGSLKVSLGEGAAHTKGSRNLLVPAQTGIGSSICCCVEKVLPNS